MLYVITGEDNENSLEKRLSVRPAHLERLKELQNQGRLVIAGPFPAIDCDDPGKTSPGYSGEHAWHSVASASAQESHRTTGNRVW